MSNQAELVGKAVDNKWHILKKIGSGSFGQVFIGKSAQNDVSYGKRLIEFRTQRKRSQISLQ
jgi:serine/threonine protein kinase